MLAFATFTMYLASSLLFGLPSVEESLISMSSSQNSNSSRGVNSISCTISLVKYKNLKKINGNSLTTAVAIVKERLSSQQLFSAKFKGGLKEVTRGK